MPKNIQNYILQTVETVPASSPKTGTIVSDGKYITGTGTLFTKEIMRGDWIFDAAQKEISRVTDIMSDTQIYLEDAFTLNLAGIPLVVTPQSRAREISLANTGGVNTTIDNNPFQSLEIRTYGEEAWYKGSQRDFVDPSVVDGATSSVTVQIIY